MEANGDPFYDLTTEEKIARNTERVQELAAKGMVLDPTNLRIGVMMETLLSHYELMETAEEKIQDKLHEEVSKVERQVARAALVAPGAPDGPPAGDGAMKGIIGRG